MRRLVLLLGLVVLAVGVWMMLPTGGGDALPVGIPGAADASGPEAGPTLTGGGLGEEETVEAVGAGFERSEVEAVGAGGDEVLELTQVLVVNKETGEPVPGAEVSYMTEAETQALSEEARENQEEFMKLARDPEAMMKRYGSTRFADSEGLVFVPVKQHTSVVGRHGELFGQTTVQANPPQPDADWNKLELERDLTLVVKVVDSNGEPAPDVAIGLLPRYEEGSGQRRYSNEIARSEAPEGLVTIRHVQWVTRGWERQQPSPIGFVLRPQVPGLEEGGVSLEAALASGEPVVLQLPPTGRVVVSTTDARGEPMAAMYGDVSLSIAPENPPDDLSQVRPQFDRQWRATAKEAGTTVFERVVAGKRYVAMAYLAMDNAVELFVGPAIEGQEVHVILAAKAMVNSFVGRVLDRERKPIAEADFQISYEYDGRGWGGAPFRTDEGGFFRVPIQDFGRDADLSRLTIQSQSRTFPPTEDAMSYSSVDVPPIIEGDNNLGDVVVEPTPVIASGRVLVDGEPAGAPMYYGLQVQVLVESQPGRTTEQWDHKPDVTVRVLEEGRFEVVGVSRPVRHRLYSSYDFGHLPFDPIEFMPGAEDLEISLRTGGSLQAVALIDEDLSLEDLVFQVIPTDGQVPEPPDRELGMYLQNDNRFLGQFAGKEEGRSKFQWRSLFPGGYRFEVSGKGATVPLVVVEDIQVATGENEDPRLEEIDLRGKFRRIRVKVVGVDGRPLPNSNYGPPVVVINNRAEDAELGGYSAQDGSVSILTAEPYVDLLVLHPGYEPVERNGVSSETTVTLAAYPEVVVRIAGGLPELPEGGALRVSLTKKDRTRDGRRVNANFIMGATVDTWLRSTTPVPMVGAAGEVRVQAQGDGAYTLRVSLRDESSRRTYSIQGTQPAEVEVRSALGEQVFEVQIPREGLQAAIEKSRGR